MSRATLLITSLFLLQGCALLGASPDPTAHIKKPVRGVVNLPFDRVWSAVQKVMVEYPLTLSDADNGVLETDWVKEDNLFLSPHKHSREVLGQKYKIKIKAVRGQLNGRPATQIFLSKNIEIQTDFLSNVASIPSDGLEETTLLYRIRREIIIENAIESYVQFKNQN